MKFDPSKVPRGLKLRDFQEMSVEYTLSHVHAYLGLDPGLGKTIIAAVCTNHIPGPVLYTTPPFLKYNVYEEFKKWTMGARRIKIVKNGKDTASLLADIVILPDSLIAKKEIREVLFKRKFKWCFIDEAHRFKTVDSKRTMALYGYKKKIKVRSLVYQAERKVPMSGTPMPNRVVELWPVLNSLAPECLDFMSYWDFARRYCGACKGNQWDVRGSQNLGELRARVAGHFMLRLKKDHVLKELPPKNEQIIMLDGIRLPKEIKAIEKNIVKKTTIGDIPKKLDDHIARWRRLVGESKVKQCAKAIWEMKGEKPIVVFTTHRKVVDDLVEAFKGFRVAIIRGGIPIEERERIVSDFQAGKIDIIIGNISAMGVGFTLTRAEDCFFVEYSWVPAENDQAADRLHRIGQLGQVNVYYFVIKDSLDEYILRTNLDKKEKIKKFCD